MHNRTILELNRDALIVKLHQESRISMHTYLTSFMVRRGQAAP